MSSIIFLIEMVKSILKDFLGQMIGLKVFLIDSLVNNSRITTKIFHYGIDIKSNLECGNLILIPHKMQAVVALRPKYIGTKFCFR